MRKAQPPYVVNGSRMKRIPAGTCITREAWEAVEETARTFGVSRSWVIAFALSKAFNVEIASFAEARRRK